MNQLAKAEYGKRYYSMTITLNCTLLLLSLTVTETSNVDREIKSLKDLKEGDLVRGYVKSCSDCGVFVRY